MTNFRKQQVPQLRSVHKIVTNFDQMICDDSFQRDFVWNIDKQREYIETVFAGSASSAIILADITSCLTASEHRGTSAGVKKLESQKSENYTESKIDGHQRTTTLKRFYDNEFTITATLIDLNGKAHSIENKFYKQLPLILQNTFLFSNVVVTVNHGFTFQEVVEQFVNVQKGDTLTPAEVRWATLSPYNFSFVKPKRDIFKKALEKVEAFEKKIIRKCDVEIFDQTILQLMPSTKGQNCGQSDLRAWYDYGDGHANFAGVPEYNQVEMDNAWKVFDEYINPILVNNGTDYNRVSIQTYWAIVAAAEYIWENGYVVSDFAGLYVLIRNTNKNLIQKSKLQQASDINIARKCVPAQDDPPDSRYYWWWCSLPHNAKVRAMKNAEFIQEFQKGLRGSKCLRKRSAKTKAA